MLKVARMPPLPQHRTKHSNKNISEKIFMCNAINAEPKMTNQSISLSSGRSTPLRPFSSNSSKSIKSNSCTEKGLLLRGNSSKEKQLYEMPFVSAKSWVVFEMK